MAARRPRHRNPPGADPLVAESQELVSAVDIHEHLGHSAARMASTLARLPRGEVDADIAARLGQKLKWDPKGEQFIGNDAAITYEPIIEPVEIAGIVATEFEGETAETAVTAEDASTA